MINPSITSKTFYIPPSFLACGQDEPVDAKYWEW